MIKNVEFQPRGSCPLCESNETLPHLPFQHIPVIKCASCGFIYSSKVMSEDSLEAYYSNEFGGKRHLQGQIVNARVNFGILSRLFCIDSSTKVLDIGTGYGFLLKELRDRYGTRCTGVELSQQEAAYGKDVLGLNIINQGLRSASLEKTSFDLVVACEVIEHTLNPIEFIEELKQFVSPSGRIVIFTDNFESELVKELGAGWPKWIPHTHISHFSPESLNSALEKAGCRIDMAYSFTPWEHQCRNLKYKLTRNKVDIGDGYNFDEAVKTEMSGKYSAYLLRKFLNPMWTRFTLRKDLNGAMMCVSAKVNCT